MKKNRLFISLFLLTGSQLLQAAEQEYTVEISSFDVDRRTEVFDMLVANDLILSLKKKLSKINKVPADELLFFMQGELLDDYDTIGKWSDKFVRGIPIHLKSITGEPISVKYGYEVPGQVCCEVRRKTNHRAQKSMRE